LVSVSRGARAVGDQAQASIAPDPPLTKYTRLIPAGIDQLHAAHTHR
jgi:hypothetical protein